MSQSAAAARETGTGWLDVAEKGSVLGIQLLVWIGTLFGRAPGRFVLRFLAFYYVLFHAGARRASRAFLARVHGRAGFWMAYRHVLRFANVALDRMFIAKRRYDLFEVSGHGIELIRRLGRERRGAILLGAHLGSFEALRMQAEADELAINVVGYFKNARMINAALERLNPGVNTRVIDVQQASMGFVLEIRECIARGEMVAILGDRAAPGSRSVAASFLGDSAEFPVGPFQLAAMLRCPVYLTFGLYREPNRYEVHCELFEEEIVMPRKARSEALSSIVQRYADRLEHYVRLAPDNWFNFYDFWRPRGGAREPPAPPGGTES
jgi:predicted LPLAT superfamily acyltransferase